VATMFGFYAFGATFMTVMLLNRYLRKVHRALILLVPAVVMMMGLFAFMLVLIAPGMDFGAHLFVLSFVFFYGGLSGLIASLFLRR